MMSRRNRQIVLYATLLACSTAMIAALLYHQLQDFWAIDRCLDAGSAWEYATSSCHMDEAP